MQEKTEQHLPVCQKSSLTEALRLMASTNDAQAQCGNEVAMTISLEGAIK